MQFGGDMNQQMMGMGNMGGMNTGMNPGMNFGMNVGMNPGMNTGMNPGMNIGMNVGMNPGMNVGMNPGMNIGMNPGMNIGMNPGMNFGMNFGMNPGMNFGINPGIMPGNNGTQVTNIDDKKGWNLIFQSTQKTVTITISEQKLIKEAISMYKLKTGTDEQCKFVFNNKELYPEMKICQSGLTNLSKITVISTQNLKGAF